MPEDPDRPDNEFGASDAAAFGAAAGLFYLMGRGISRAINGPRRTCPQCNGEKVVGKVIVCRVCEGSRTFLGRTCPECNGLGGGLRSVTCAGCSGKGWIRSK